MQGERQRKFYQKSFQSTTLCFSIAQGSGECSTFSEGFTLSSVSYLWQFNSEHLKELILNLINFDQGYWKKKPPYNNFRMYVRLACVFCKIAKNKNTCFCLPSIILQMLPLFCFRREMLLPERALSKIALTQIILETRIGHKNMFHCFCYLEGCQQCFQEECSWKQKSQVNCLLQQQDSRISIL